MRKVVDLLDALRGSLNKVTPEELKALNFPTARSVRLLPGSKQRFFLQIEIKKPYGRVLIPVSVKAIPELKRSVDRLNREFLEVRKAGKIDAAGQN